MGRVICKTHGASGGPLCCDHVLAAVYKNGPRVQYHKVTYDASGDGSCVLSHLLCTGCLERYGLESTKEVTDDVWGDRTRFPNTCPVCEECLAEYERKQ